MTNSSTNYECEICDIMSENIRKIGQQYNDSLKLCKFFEDRNNYIILQYLPVEYVNSQKNIVKNKIDNYHKANKQFMKHYKQFHSN